MFYSTATWCSDSRNGPFKVVCNMCLNPGDSLVTGCSRASEAERWEGQVRQGPSGPECQEPSSERGSG